jgi:hypothetical protein
MQNDLITDGRRPRLLPMIRIHRDQDQLMHELTTTTQFTRLQDSPPRMRSDEIALGILHSDACPVNVPTGRRTTHLNAL